IGVETRLEDDEPAPRLPPIPDRRLAMNSRSALSRPAMPGRIRAPLIIAAVVSAGIVLSGCNLFGRGDRDEELLATPERPAGELYNEGLAYMEQGKLRNAIESFEEVDRQHPYTDYARKALIMSAFANFRRGEYEDAVTSAQRFLTLYPGNEDA